MRLLIVLLVVSTFPSTTSFLRSPSCHGSRTRRLFLSGTSPNSNREKDAAAAAASLPFSFAPTLAEALRRVEAKLGPLEPYPAPPDLLRGATSAPRAGVATRTEVVALRGGPLRQIRAAVVEPARVPPGEGEGASSAEPLAAQQPLPAFPRVLNLVAFPDPTLRLPVFGADLVTLPGGHLVAVDLHPCCPRTTTPTWSSRACATSTPGTRCDLVKATAAMVAAAAAAAAAATPTNSAVGRDLPEEAQPFFSPCAMDAPAAHRRRAAHLATRICGSKAVDSGGGSDGNGDSSSSDGVVSSTSTRSSISRRRPGQRRRRRRRPPPPPKRRGYAGEGRGGGGEEEEERRRPSTGARSGILDVPRGEGPGPRYAHAAARRRLAERLSASASSTSLP